MSFFGISFKTKNKKQKRRYEGASKGKRFSRWSTNGLDSNAELSPSLPALRNRARDLRRNNPYASRGIMAIANNVIGKGIKTQIRGEGSDSIETLWNDWTKNKNFDHEGRLNFFQVQHLVTQALVESGEVLLKKVINKSLNFPLTYQVLEADFIDTTRSDIRLPSGNFILQGIEFNQSGKRVAYYLYERHPGSIVADPKSSFTSNRVPASDVHHIFRQDRPGQVRGVTWLAPVIVRLKDLDDYEDAQLVRQKVAACFAAFVKDINGDIDSEDDCDLGEKIEPGIIEFLPPGKDIEFATPPSVENYKEYITTNLRAIASGLGVTFENLTGDLSEVNFSSGRMGHLEFQRNIDAWRSNIIISQMIDPIVSDFKEMATLLGIKTDGLNFVHVPPKREMIDPTREIPATINAIRGGLTTLSDEIMAQGNDPEEHFLQYSKDLETLDALGITLDSDPRNTSKGGNIQVEVSSNEQEENKGSTE